MKTKKAKKPKSIAMNPPTIADEVGALNRCMSALAPLDHSQRSRIIKYLEAWSSGQAYVFKTTWHQPTTTQTTGQILTGGGS